MAPLTPAKKRFQQFAFDVINSPYGKTADELTYLTGALAYSTSEFIPFENNPRWLTNLEFSVNPTRELTVSFGANKVFDRYPNKIPTAARYYNTEKYDGDASQIGIDGGYYYARLDVKL